MNNHSTCRRGFTLMETVIAIGVLAVLLTAFMAVFGPAAAGIRKSISAQDADRMVSSFEEELSTLRATDAKSYTTAFDKAYNWIKDSSKTPVLLYQYRADPSKALRSDDGTMQPYVSSSGIPGTSGKDFVLRTAVRRRDDTKLADDMKALEGRVFCVLSTQLIFKTGELVKGTAATIVDPITGAGTSKSDDLQSAVIAFNAEFYILPSAAYAYVKPGGAFDPAKLANPVFTRNLAVRR